MRTSRNKVDKEIEREREGVNVTLSLHDNESPRNEEMIHSSSLKNTRRLNIR